jgi:hypothetical protein
MKVRIEEELRRNPSYGSRRLARALQVNHLPRQESVHLHDHRPVHETAHGRLRGIASIDTKKRS